MKKFKPNYDEGMWKGAPESSFAKAKALRKDETQAEKILWAKLRNNQLKGYKFRRQHPIGLYIVDFYCHQLKLVIEIDGDYHNI
jgi:very-short-patch-repair endonuclease